MWSYIKNSLHSILFFHPQDVCMTYVEHFMFRYVYQEDLQ